MDAAWMRILLHTLGIDRYDTKDPNAYRDYFAADPSNERLKAMANAGLVRRYREPSEGMPYDLYETTELGKHEAFNYWYRHRKPKKARVYSRFLDCREANADLTFRDFLVEPEYADIRRQA